MITFQRRYIISQMHKRKDSQIVYELYNSQIYFLVKIKYIYILVSALRKGSKGPAIKCRLRQTVNSVGSFELLRRARFTLGMWP